MKKYFLEEIKKFVLQVIIFIGIILFIVLNFIYPILLIPSLLFSVLYYLWQKAKESYEWDRKTDEKHLYDLYLDIYGIAVIYKNADKGNLDSFQKAFEKYCEKYPKDKNTIDRYTKCYEELKRMFKSLDMEG